MANKEEIEVKNNKVLLSSLRNDIIEASTALSKGYAELKEVNEEISVAKAELTLIELAKKDALDEIQRERTELKNAVSDSDKKLENTKEQVKVVRKQKNESLNELKRLNEWIFTAEDKQKKLSTENAELEQETLKKKEYIKDISTFKKKRDEAIEEHRLVLVDTKLAKDEAEALISLSEKKIKDAEEYVLGTKKEAQQASEELERAVSEKIRIQSDLEVYIKRIEVHYKQAFPELRMKF